MKLDIQKQMAWLGVALFAVAGAAYAEGKVTGSVSSSELSGDAPGGKSTLDVKTISGEGDSVTTSEQWGLGGLYFAEKGDDACLIGNLRTSMNGRHIAETTSNDIVAPPCSGGTYGSWETIKFGKADMFVRAIQVCTTDKRNKADKIKGAEIWAAHVDNNGKVTEEDLSMKFRRKNCERWRERVACPANQVAIGIEATWGDNGFAGIKLRCTAVTKK